MSDNQVVQRTSPNNFPAMLEAYKTEIQRALPRHLNPDNMMRVALTCFRMNPKLAQCQPVSVFSCVIQASQLGLRPGMLGECYLIPFKDQCQLVIGYQGLLELVRRSGLVDSIAAYVVREKDEFNVRFGTDPGVTHVPYLDGDAGAPRLFYAVAKLKGGGTHVEVMSLTEVEKIMNASQNVKNARAWNKTTPWDDHFDEMGRKTILRRICKYLPKSNELALGLALNDAGERGAQALTLTTAALPPAASDFVPPPFPEDAQEPAQPAAPAPETRTEQVEQQIKQRRTRKAATAPVDPPFPPTGSTEGAPTTSGDPFDAPAVQSGVAAPEGAFPDDDPGPKPGPTPGRTVDRDTGEIVMTYGYVRDKLLRATSIDEVNDGRSLISSVRNENEQEALRGIADGREAKLGGMRL